jgi:hypothetical protein
MIKSRSILKSLPTIIIKILVTLYMYIKKAKDITIGLIYYISSKFFFRLGGDKNRLSNKTIRLYIDNINRYIK